MPALYNLRGHGLLPREIAVVGQARSAGDDATFRTRMTEALRESVSGFDQAAWDTMCPHLLLCQRRVRRPRDVRRAVGEDRRRRGRRRRAPECAVLHGHAARGLWDDRHAPRARWPREGRRRSDRVDAHRRREAVRPRPGIGARLEPHLAHRLRRAADLPDRPLPRERDRAEHPDVPLPQRHLRAGVEPPLRRSCADHCGRDARRRRPRGLLRDVGGAARHAAEPLAAAAYARGNGTADLARRRGPAQRKGQGAARHPAVS